MGKRVMLLGVTGSIGRQALEVIAEKREEYQVAAIAARHSWEAVVAAVREFAVPWVALADPRAAERAASELGAETKVLAGPEAIQRLFQSVEADIVLNAVVGAAGLEASYLALRSGAQLALANKESLVVGGPALSRLGLERLVPVDSEHSAVFQCLSGQDYSAIRRIILTASGGPFRGWNREQLRKVTPTEALQHPTWNMGAKITIDSATLMNKGLEVIEAHWLFGVDYDQIDVVVHPESIVHSLVELRDGAVLAQLGLPDMRLPIAYALSHPDRLDYQWPRLDLTRVGVLHFGGPDRENFPSLELAYRAGRAGGTAPCVLNAANEAAVAAFLAGELSLAGIPDVVAQVLDEHRVTSGATLDELRETDGWARARARAVIARSGW